MAKFSERLKELRRERHFKQKEMAEELGLGQRAYESYEREERCPDFHGLIRLADYFDVSLDYLVGRSDVRERR